MQRNEAAAPIHVCPEICIQAIDIFQPPGIGISPIADMDVHQAIVTPALTANSSAEETKNAFLETLSEAITPDSVQRFSYSSWRRHQMPFSLRPLGARSSH